MELFDGREAIIDTVITSLTTTEQVEGMLNLLPFLAIKISARNEEDGEIYTVHV